MTYILISTFGELIEILFGCGGSVKYVNIIIITIIVITNIIIIFLKGEFY